MQKLGMIARNDRI